MYKLPIALLALALAVSSPAAADETDTGRLYTGGTIGPRLTLGQSVLHDGGDIGWQIGVAARFNTVMTAFHLDIGWDLMHHSLDGLDGPVSLNRHGLSVSVGLHPLFLRLFNNNWLWRTLTAWYVQGGVGAQFTRLKAARGPLDRRDTAFSVHVGSGIEAPLWNPDGWGALWLGVAWRWTFVFMNPALPRQDDLNSHSLSLSLALRFNNINWTRVARPPELKWR